MFVLVEYIDDMYYIGSPKCYTIVCVQHATTFRHVTMYKSLYVKKNSKPTHLFLSTFACVVYWGVMHVRRQSKSQTTEKSGTINVVTFAAANLLCTNQTWGRANEVSDFPREVSDNWGHAILSWAIPSNGQAPGRETPFSGDD